MRPAALHSPDVASASETLVFHGIRRALLLQRTSYGRLYSAIHM